MDKWGLPELLGLPLALSPLLTAPLLPLDRVLPLNVPGEILPGENLGDGRLRLLLSPRSGKGSIVADGGRRRRLRR